MSPIMMVFLNTLTMLETTPQVEKRMQRISDEAEFLVAAVLTLAELIDRLDITVSSRHD